VFAAAGRKHRLSDLVRRQRAHDLAARCQHRVSGDVAFAAAQPVLR
jgi:hypothetical protein